MRYKLVKHSKLEDIDTDCLVIPVKGAQDRWKKRNSVVKKLDSITQGMVMKALEQGDLPAKSGKTLMLPLPAGMKARRLLLVYAGSKETLGQKEASRMLKGTASRLKEMSARNVTLLWADLKIDERPVDWLIQRTVSAIEEVTYQFDNYKSKASKPVALETVSIIPSTKSTLPQKALKEAVALAEGMKLSKDLGNLPGNECTPAFLAAKATELAKEYPDLTVKVMNESEMKKLGMGSLLSVAAGSQEPARLIVFEYRKGKKTARPTILVGKGITFDSGGISLKPGARMDEMKFDMCGAATVFGVFLAVLKLKPSMNLVGIVAASENMPDGKATKPGDVVTSMSGKTIEILNTDAEGRLVLCDALTYARRFNPEYVIDVATLTGACVVALGAHASGLYANDDELADKLLAAGEYSNDKAWRMPLWDEYQQQIDSKVADVANVGGAGAGSVTAACFLERFAKDFRWAHMDIAGSAWSSTRKRSTGRPVGLLYQFLLNG